MSPSAALSGLGFFSAAYPGLPPRAVQRPPLPESWSAHRRSRPGIGRSPRPWIAADAGTDRSPTPPTDPPVPSLDPQVGFIFTPARPPCSTLWGTAPQHPSSTSVPLGNGNGPRVSPWAPPQGDRFGGPSPRAGGPVREVDPTGGWVADHPC